MIINQLKKIFVRSMSTLPQRRNTILLTLVCLYEIISLSYNCACQQEIDPDDLAWTSWRPRGPSPTSNTSPPSSSALLFLFFPFLYFTISIKSIPSSHTSTYSSGIAGKKQQQTNKTDLHPPICLHFFYLLSPD